MDYFTMFRAILMAAIFFHGTEQQAIRTGSVDRRLASAGQRQPQFGAARIGQAGFGRGGQQQSQFLLQQQSQLGQPALVNVGGCSRGVSLRNADGSTLVCGFGPRDFSCPPEFSCTFDNSLRGLVCCPSQQVIAENASRPDSFDSPPNPCHEGDPVKDEFGHRLQCNLSGGPVITCPSGTLCVSSSCCPVSIAGLISVKPGKCPLPLPVPPGSNCQNDCTFDADCPGVAKCCFVGCGARCVTSATFGAAPGPSGVGPADQGGLANPSVGGPLSGNGASLSQFNLVPTRNEGIFFQQQRPQFGQQNILGPQDPRLLQQLQSAGPPGFARGAPPRGPPRGGAGFPQQNLQPQFSAANRQFDQASA